MMGKTKLLVSSLLIVVAVVSCSLMRHCDGAGAGAGDGFNDDVLGLIVFKSGIDDPSSSLSTWNEDDDTPCSTWSHVQCSPATGRVTSIALDGLGLSGHLPSHGLEKLSELDSLSLAHNNLSGVIPPHLAAIPSLHRLNLSGNALTGSVPAEFAAMPSIRVLDLSNNGLAGPLQDSLFRNGTFCSSLRVLDLSGNAFDGPVPPSLSQCGFLLALNLSGNRFSGSPDFSNTFFSLTRIRSLDISGNQLAGEVPDAAAALHNVKELRISHNAFTGAIPASIGLCPHLEVLDISSNSFTGAMPDSIRNLAALSYLNASSNALTGDFPVWVGSLTSLRVLDLSGNKLTGSLPSSLGNLKDLNYIGADNNALSGEISYRIAECTKLSAVRLHGNALSGPIPPGLFDLGLEHLDLSSNSLTGPIPPGSTRLFETLRSLDLSMNKLTGDIPPEMALYFNLRYLNLSWNDLRSRLPPELGYFRNLSVLDLRNSALYGPIPGDLCDSDSLSVLQLDGNLLTGPIPEEIGNCSSLYLLGLSHNSLNGSIPTATANLRKLKILNLEYNNLGGEIPPELARLEELLAVNISHNRLIGRLPLSRIFQSLDATAIEGNLGICSPLVMEPCKMNVPKPLVLDPNAYNRGNNNGDGDGDDMVDGSGGSSADAAAAARERHRRFLSVSAIVAISAAMVIIIGVVVVSLLNVSARRRLGSIENAIDSMCSSSTKSGGGGAGPAVGRLVLFGPRSNLRSDDLVGGAESLLHKATEIGRGAFGTVYKTSIGEGSVVAVKKLLTSSIVQYHDDFDREVRTLGKARHPNLMPLKGYYWTPQLQLLLSDYASQGNLQSRLHERSPEQPPLTWAQRFRIALGAAKGLAHLHHSFRPPIIHYDVRPSNVLLDGDTCARVSDFGLARLLPRLDKHAVSGRLRSALGYVAPEMACQSLRVNEKCDVYGYGVTVLELVTGRRAVEYGEDDVVVLVDRVRAALEAGSAAAEVVDEGMGAFPEEEVMPVLKLGLVCASQIPSSRPTMAEVVQILQVIKTPVPERMEAF